MTAEERVAVLFERNEREELFHCCGQLGANDEARQVMRLRWGRHGR